MLICDSQIVLRKDNLARATEQRFAYECSDSLPAFARRLNSVADVFSILATRFRIIRLVETAIDIGHNYFVNVFGRSPAARAVELVGAYLYQGTGIAVIGTIHNDHIFSARVRSRETNRQLVCFTTR